MGISGLVDWHWPSLGSPDFVCLTYMVPMRNMAFECSQVCTWLSELSTALCLCLAVTPEWSLQMLHSTLWSYMTVPGLVQGVHKLNTGTLTLSNVLLLRKVCRQQSDMSRFWKMSLNKLNPRTTYMCQMCSLTSKISWSSISTPTHILLCTSNHCCIAYDTSYNIDAL